MIMKHIKYLITAQIHKKEFLLEIKSNFKEAEKLMEAVFTHSSKFPPNEVHEIENKLKYFASYIIREIDCEVQGTETSKSYDGFTVSVIKIDMRTFCLKTFIKERENSALVFDFESYDPEYKLDGFMDLFPDADLIAN